MATASRHLCRSITRLSSHTPAKRKITSFIQSPHRAAPFHRHFSCMPRRFADQATPPPPKQTSDQTTEETVEETEEQIEDVIEQEIDESELQVPDVPFTASDLDPEARASFDQLSKPEQQQYLAVQNHFKAISESGPANEALEGMAEQVSRDLSREMPGPLFAGGERDNVAALRSSMWAMDEDDEFGVVEDNDEEAIGYENITSVAESELEVHREIREYYRIAAWDLPLLEQYAKAFDEPTFQRPLRFRYTTYMGEHHPAAKKVVVEFKVGEMQQAAKLSDAQLRKLKLLVGPRYNPEREIIKMSCEKFENPAQNKRYLGEMVEKLLKEAKNKADMFEDVPLDLRHHKWSNKPKFPERWNVKDEKDVQRLLEQRQQANLLGEAEQPVDGKQLVKMYVEARGVAAAAAPGLAGRQAQRIR